MKTVRFRPRLALVCYDWGILYTMYTCTRFRFEPENFPRSHQSMTRQVPCLTCAFERIARTLNPLRRLPSYAYVIEWLCREMELTVARFRCSGAGGKWRGGGSCSQAFAVETIDHVSSRKRRETVLFPQRSMPNDHSAALSCFAPRLRTQVAGARWSEADATAWAMPCSLS